VPLFLGGHVAQHLSTRWARKLVELRRLVLFALPIGLIVGIGVSGLEALCNEVLWARLGTTSIYLRPLFPILGLLLSGYVLNRLQLRTVGMLNEVVTQYHAPPAPLSALEDTLKLGACVATVGLGASAGLGGPSQWLGARTALYFREGMRGLGLVRPLPSREALLVGAAAGVSAIFRAPLAGTLLALETPFSRDLDGTALLPASVAALAAHVVHGWLIDSAPLLPLPAEAPHGPAALLSAAALGVAAGLLSRRYQRVTASVRAAAGVLPWWQRAALGGLVTAATGVVAWRYFGDTWTFQGGLPLAHAAFDARYLGLAAAALLALKLVAVWATFGTTGVGGVLFVTLTVGSLLGAALQPLLPALSPSVACAVAVCAYLGANYNAPLTAIALATEWGGTGLLPLAWVAVLVATWIGEGLANTPAKSGHRRRNLFHH
jgi:CIC family chloride channel protein